MKQLPPDTVRLLSSSQVITSVLNVVKELVENSLDAGALNIDVKLENFGLDRIEVRDNGHGIKAVDAPVVAVRHFTSKICSHEDLEHLETYGFRGEALGSICAVAEVAVTTKTEADDLSTQYSLDSTGIIVSQKPSHLGQGTTVSVTKLFRNLPVRRQFYSSTKKCKEELKKVQELLMAYALVKPELRLLLVHNKVVIWQKAKAADNRSALVATLGSGIVPNLLPCHQRHEQPEIVIDGFFPKPGVDFSSTSLSTPEKTFIFINNRPVHDKEVMKEAVLTAVEALLVSLYGFRPGSELPPEQQLNHETLPPPLLPTDASHLKNKRSDINVLTEAEKYADSAQSSDVSLERQASNTSSSSSTADDWIVNKFPAEIQSNFSLCDDGIATKMSSVSKSPEGRGHADVSAAETRKHQISAEDWSRGTALADSVSGEPLQPIVILQPSKPSPSDSDEAKILRSPGKKMLNAITEKPAALTAYDRIRNRTTRAPLSPVALFEKDTRAEVLREKPAASLQDISIAVQEKWKNLGEDDRKKYEEKARKSLEHYNQKTSAEGLREPDEKTPRTKLQAQKRKAPLSNQQLLDQLFAQPQKKPKAPASRPSRPLSCSVPALRLQLQRLSSQSSGAPQGLHIVNRLASQSTWVILCGQRLMLLNPFRVEETLLFKRLLENNILPSVSLQNPVQLTDGSLGGAEYVETLCNMEKQKPDLNGGVLFSDPRLVANGFKIKLTAERHLEVTAMADCVPFLGVEDLREILTAVLHRKASTVRECRPLKVTNYLQAEAVRLARQLPITLPREDVEEIIRRMEQQLGESSHICIHGRPFLQHLADVPSTDGEAQAQFRPLGL